MSIDYYSLIDEGLSKKYLKQVGPVQEIELTYNNKDDISIKDTKLNGDIIEVEFVGNFNEIKTINYDNTKPTIIITKLDCINGTLFIENEKYLDIILEFDNEAI